MIRQFFDIYFLPFLIPSCQFLAKMGDMSNKWLNHFFDIDSNLGWADWLIDWTDGQRFDHQWDKTLSEVCIPLNGYPDTEICLIFVEFYMIWQDFTWFEFYMLNFIFFVRILPDLTQMLIIVEFYIFYQDFTWFDTNVDNCWILYFLSGL